MKAITKAKRRTILSACGLGMLDETEADTIPGARVETVASLHPVATTVTVEPAQAPEPEPVVVVDATPVDEYVASLEPEQMAIEVGILWRKLKLSPIKAKEHLHRITGSVRVGELSVVKLASYLDILRDEAAAQGIV